MCDSGRGRTRHARPPRKLDFHGLALEGAAARRGRRVSRVGKGTFVSSGLTKASSVRRTRLREDRGRVMPDDGSRTHLGAFLPFRDELEPLFGFFARFSTRAGAPVSLDGADASAGMVSRAAALSPRKNKHPLPGYPHPPLRPSRRARRRGDNFAPRVRPPRDLYLRAGAALVDCALEGRGSLGKIAFSTLSFARRVGTSRLENRPALFKKARVFGRRTVKSSPQRLAQRGRVGCARLASRARPRSSGDRSPEGSRDPRFLGRGVPSRNPASFKRDALPWRRRTGPRLGRPASAPPRRRTARR